MNHGVVGPASNEVAVQEHPGCQVPGAPTDFTGIMRGSTVYMGWNDGNGGIPSQDAVVARYQSGGPVIAALPIAKPAANGVEPPQGGYLNVGGVPNGTLPHAEVARAERLRHQRVVERNRGECPEQRTGGPGPERGPGRSSPGSSTGPRAGGDRRRGSRIDGSQSRTWSGAVLPADDIEARKTQRTPTSTSWSPDPPPKFRSALRLQRQTICAERRGRRRRDCVPLGQRRAGRVSPNVYLIDMLRRPTAPSAASSRDYRPLLQ